jgi:uncharacterized membrane protein
MTKGNLIIFAIIISIFIALLLVAYVIWTTVHGGGPFGRRRVIEEDDIIEVG